MAMSWMQRLVTRFVPRSWAESMETESRDWVVRCGSCEFERSIWDLGGIRWKATGNPKTYGRCPNCGQRSWFSITRRRKPEPQPPDAFAWDEPDEPDPYAWDEPEKRDGEVMG